MSSFSGLISSVGPRSWTQYRVTIQNSVSSYEYCIVMEVTAGYKSGSGQTGVT